MELREVINLETGEIAWMSEEVKAEWERLYEATREHFTPHEYAGDTCPF